MSTSAASAFLIPSAAATTKLASSSSSSSSLWLKPLRSSFSPLFLSPPAFWNRSLNSRLLFTKTGGDLRCNATSSSYVEQLKSAREDTKLLLNTNFCHPILVRLGWHDAGTYNKDIKEWPQRGGANGSLRFEVELKHGANAGLINALRLLQPIKDKYPNITYADLFQLASATSIEEAGGPKIPMKYGRLDVSGPDQCPEEGRLPGLIIMKSDFVECIY